MTTVDKKNIIRMNILYYTRIRYTTQKVDIQRKKCLINQWIKRPI